MHASAFPSLSRLSCGGGCRNDVHSKPSVPKLPSRGACDGVHRTGGRCLTLEVEGRLRPESLSNSVACVLLCRNANLPIVHVTSRGVPDYTC